MALSASAFTTLTQAKTTLGVSGSADDAEIERLIEAISDAMRKATNRPHWHEQTVTDVPARVMSNRHLAIIPMHGPVPITTLTAVKLDGSALDVTKFGTHLPTLGVLYYQGSLSWVTDRVSSIAQPPYPGNEPESTLADGYTVDYTGGWNTGEQVGTTTFPGALEEAGLQWLTSWWKRQGSDPRIANEQLMSYAVGYSVTGQLSVAITAAVAMVLKAYRLPSS